MVDDSIPPPQILPTSFHSLPGASKKLSPPARPSSTPHSPTPSHVDHKRPLLSSEPELVGTTDPGGRLGRRATLPPDVTRPVPVPRNLPPTVRQSIASTQSKQSLPSKHEPTTTVGLLPMRSPPPTRRPPPVPQAKLKRPPPPRLTREKILQDLGPPPSEDPPEPPIQLYEVSRMR